MSVKGKSAMSIKLDDRYKVIIEIAVKKMKADGIQSATKTDVVRQALELYAKERQITNDVIHNELNGTEQNTTGVIPDKKFTAKDLLKYSGTWAGGKEDAEKVLKYIIENRTEAEF
ncbi:MAG: hypothetical protein QG588_2404 [Candidatus Poribacteria bacterium]|nr:hypothetical protein [Candidatus Poribacteria bacterium]